MNKRALPDVDPHTVGRYGLGGLITGGGTAALLNLIRELQSIKERKRDLQEPSETDSGTIVLTLPPKAGAATKGKKGDKPMIKKVETTKITTCCGPKSQIRHAHTGAFGVKTAATRRGWPTLTASVLAGGSGAAVGAYLVNKVYENRRERMLEDDLSAAQQEYMDMLQGNKVATVLDDLFDTSLGKEAQFGALDYPMATLALLGLLGTGGSAYITKRILDEKARESDERGLDVPKLNRIIFKSAPGATVEKGAEEDIDCVKTAVCIMLDQVGGTTDVLGDEQVKQAMAQAGTSSDDLYKMAQDADLLMEHLRQTPKLRQMIQRAALEKHPILKHFKWSLGLPGIKQYADKKLYDSANKTFGQPKVASEKKALNFANSAVASLLGSTVAEGQSSKDLASAIVSAQEQARGVTEKKENPAQAVAGIQLQAEGPEAQAYLERNKDKVRLILSQMSSAGTI